MRIFLLVMAIFMLPSVAAGDGTQEETIENLLHAFLDGAGRGDVAVHERFWAEELVYTSSSGTRFGKAELLRGVRETRGEDDGQSHRYWAEDTHIMLLDHMAIVTFKLRAETRAENQALVEESTYFNTGTFRLKDGQWRALAWQATRIPAAEAAPE